MMPDPKNLAALLRQALHDKKPPELLPSDCAEQDEFQVLYNELIELRHFIMSVATGDLSGRIAFKGYTAGALKTLQANLKHLTWQTQRIAAGDFSQRLDFMGEFSKAFNSMTEQLENSIRIIMEKEAELSTTNAGLLQEIEARKQTQAALAEREAHYRNLTETMKDVVWILDIKTLRFTYISPSVKDLRGFTPEEIMAQPMDAALTPESAVYVRARLQERRDGFLAGNIPENQFFTAEIEQPRKDGTTVWTEAITHYVFNEKTGAVELHGVTRDITERRALRMELERQATTDELTGICNRRYFLACAEKEMERCQRHGTALSFLMLDIDHFKRVNDAYGHAVGDLALQAVAKSCAGLLRSSDSIGRLGGEEFAMLLVESNIDQACIAAERLRQQVEAIALTTADGQSVSLRVSIGVTERRMESDTLSAMMVRADQALYLAKKYGRNKVECRC
jgi:diguanylate cyclase (GGDEF)-like protein/PAS domain S-box-containing protein